MNWRRGYQTATSPFFFPRIWTRSGLIRGDPKFGQGLGYVAALQVKCLRVWGECDFHVNWLHVSRIQPTHWRLNDDFDINRMLDDPVECRLSYICLACLLCTL